MGKFNVMSADSHLEISPERWTGRVPAKFRDRAPHLIKLAHGGDGVVLEGRDVYVLGLAITGRPPEEHRLFGLNYEGSPGAGSSADRIKEQDQDGVDGEVMYTSAGNANFWRGIRNDDAYNAVIHAYNEFLAEEYAAGAPDRLFPMGVMPQSSIEAALAELQYCGETGLKGIMLSDYPSAKGHPAPDDDRFWAMALDIGMPVTAHVNFPGRKGPHFAYPLRPPEAGFGADPVRAMGRFAQGEHMAVVIALMLAGVFDRFPELRIYFAETQIGWLPESSEQLDDTYDRNRFWMERDFGLAPLERRPSDYLRDNTIWGFISDPFGVKICAEMGIHNVMWGSDFPHSASNWPHSDRLFDRMFDGVDDDVKATMTNDNAVDFFHLGNGR